MQSALMGERAELRWSGRGRWLAFGLAGFMVLSAAFTSGRWDGPSIGWNIFLGLLLFGTIASNHRKAPLLLIILAARTALGIALGLFSGLTPLDAALNVVLLVVAVGAAYDLGRQLRLADMT
jgi:hypothetical protein